MKTGSLIACVVLPWFAAGRGFGQEAGSGQSVRSAAYDAYNARRYGDCGLLFAQAAAGESGAVAANDYYNAGCCRALSGKIDAALEMLKLAIDSWSAGTPESAPDRPMGS